MITRVIRIIVAVAVTLGASLFVSAGTLSDSAPAAPVKLIFIHHSCGEAWLADDVGGLGHALAQNNYFVSDTNYGWGPDSIGDRTDIVNWTEWFVGSRHARYLDALYRETGQHCSYTRLFPDPGGENKIVMFKSCFPNSDLYGDPEDRPYLKPNDWEFSVSNAKAVYNSLLEYFATRLDKLFVVITAPPLAAGEYTVNDPDTLAAKRSANARAFNNWLVRDWLASYPHRNVAVFDYYNVLTSNGSRTRTDDTTTPDEPSDYDLRPDGNHHYWDGTRVVHVQTVDNDFSAYPSYSGGEDDYYDSHPTASGQRKATLEFVPLLNVFYNRWRADHPASN